MSNQNIRDYGYGASPEPKGPPTVVGQVKDESAECPNCKCATLYHIEVEVEAPKILRMPEGKRAITHYIGCPACPWASPAMITAK